MRNTFSSSTFGRHAGFWLVITAAIELAVAGLFVAIAMTAGEIGAEMMLTAAILGVVGIVLLVVGLKVRRSAAANEALLRDGRPAQATLIGLSQTGMYLNNNPQVAMDLRVELPGHEPYVVTRKEFVPLILLGRLGSGVPLPARVDPANAQRLVIDWGNVALATLPAAAPALAATPTGLGGPLLAAAPSLATAAAAPGPPAAAAAVPDTAPAPTTGASAALAGLPFGIRATVPAEAAQQLETMRAWLRQTGEAGTARIDQATDTGVLVGADRLFTIEATLELPGRAPEKLPPVVAMVAPDDVEKVREGYRVPVRVAPDNHQLIDFDW